MESETAVAELEERQDEHEEAELLEEQPFNQVVQYSVTLAQIAKLAEQYKEVPADLTIKENYAFCQKGTSHIRGLRGKVEDRRKNLKQGALEFGRKVDSVAKELKEKLLAIEEPMAKAKKDHDTKIEIEKREKALAEERRVDAINERIAGIKALVEAHISSPSIHIAEAIYNVEHSCVDIGWAEEFAEKAKEVARNTISKLNELYDLKVSQEKAAAEAAIEADRRKKEEEEARIKREEELKEAEDEAAKQKEEMDRQQAELEAEKQKMAAENAKLKAELEALKKKSTEPEAKAEEPVKTSQVQEAKPASPASTSNGLSDDYRAAANAILKIIGNKQITKTLMDAICAGLIPNVSFTGAI